MIPSQIKQFYWKPLLRVIGAWTMVCLSIGIQPQLLGGDLPSGSTATKENPEGNISLLTKGNNAFALELYQNLQIKEKNIFYSPYCISAALAIPFAGSSGATQTEMRSVLHYMPVGDGLYQAFYQMNKHLSTPFQQGANETRLIVANSLWIQRDLPILPAFAEITSKYFSSSFKKTDFMRNPQESTGSINNWVKDNTYGRISELIQKDDIDSTTRLVVVSTIFAKAVWRHPFDPSLTKMAPFFVSKTNITSVPTMSLTDLFPFYQEEAFSLLELPYNSDMSSGSAQLSFLIFLPGENTDLSSLENTLTPDQLEGYLNKLESRRVVVSLPKFTLEEELELNTPLQHMGMSTAFSGGADFSLINGSKDLAISKVLHKAYVSVDEHGTEAVAATAVSIGVKSFFDPNAAAVFKADHPFIFFIMDRSTNAILFMGRVADPHR